MASDLDRSIERFLRNAVRERTTEDRILRQVLRDLRLSLQSVRRFLDAADLLTPSPGREQAIRTAVSAIAASMARQWGQPTLQGFQAAMVPWFEQQLELARDLARLSGDALPQAGAVTAANAGLARIVNESIVGGKTLAQSLQQSIPVLVADRVERLVRLGLSDVAGETYATYKDAVVRTTENAVEAIIRTGVHEVGSAAQQLIYEVETSPEFRTAKALVWTAVLDGRTCPICIGLDGKRFPVDYQKVSPHFNCRCYLVPTGWRDEPGASRPSGEGLQGPEVSFTVSARDWVKSNREAARDIFGKRLGDRLADGELDFSQALKQWRQPRGRNA